MHKTGHLPLTLDDFPPLDIAADTLYDTLLSNVLGTLEPLATSTAEDERADPVLYLARQAAYHAAGDTLTAYINAHTASVVCKVLAWDREQRKERR